MAGIGGEVSDSFKWLREIGEGRDGVRMPTFGSPGEIRFINSSRKLWDKMVAVIEAAEKVAADRKLTLGMTADECELCDALDALQAARKEVEGK